MTKIPAHLVEHPPKPDDPLRLAVAAAIAFPDGSMTASGLRKEHGKGRLAIEQIAGKDYTTLANIERMRATCQKDQKGRDCASSRRDQGEAADRPNPLGGSSETVNASDRQASARAKLASLKVQKTPSATTSTARRRPASETVIPLRSRSQTS